MSNSLTEAPEVVTRSESHSQTSSTTLEVPTSVPSRVELQQDLAPPLVSNTESLSGIISKENKASMNNRGFLAMSHNEKLAFFAQGDQEYEVLKRDIRDLLKQVSSSINYKVEGNNVTITKSTKEGFATVEMKDEQGDWLQVLVHIASGNIAEAKDSFGASLSGTELIDVQKAMVLAFSGDNGIIKQGFIDDSSVNDPDIIDSRTNPATEPLPINQPLATDSQVVAPTPSNNAELTSGILNSNLNPLNVNFATLSSQERIKMLFTQAAKNDPQVAEALNASIAEISKPEFLLGATAIGLLGFTPLGIGKTIQQTAFALNNFSITANSLMLAGTVYAALSADNATEFNAAVNSFQDGVVRLGMQTAFLGVGKFGGNLPSPLGQIITTGAPTLSVASSTSTYLQNSEENINPIARSFSSIFPEIEQWINSNSAGEIINPEGFLDWLKEGAQGIGRLWEEF
jgi:hypothetical protein